MCRRKAEKAGEKWKDRQKLTTASQAQLITGMLIVVDCLSLPSSSSIAEVHCSFFVLLWDCYTALVHELSGGILSYASLTYARNNGYNSPLGTKVVKYVTIHY